MALIENSFQAEILRRIVTDDRPVARTDLMRALGVSRSKISLDVAALLEAGLLEEAGQADSEGGRPSGLLRISRTCGAICAVELGATSIDVALTTLASEILVHRSENADLRDGPKTVMARVEKIIAGLIGDLSSSLPLLGVGIVVPGPVEQASGLPTMPALMPGWDRYPLRHELAGEYGVPAVVDNEVNAMAAAEHRTGVARGVSNVLFVKIGTGIGAGIIMNHELYRGTHGAAGDIGHICVDPGGPICPCGNRGCLGAVAGGRAIADEAHGHAANGDSDVLGRLLADRGHLDVQAVAEAASQGDYWATQTIMNAGRKVGETLASVVSVLNPGLIVIGGGVAHAGHRLLAEIRSAVYHRSLPLATRNLPIVPSELGEDAGVIGASVLTAEQLLGSAPPVA